MACHLAPSSQHASSWYVRACVMRVRATATTFDVRIRNGPGPAHDLRARFRAYSRADAVALMIVVVLACVPTTDKRMKSWPKSSMTSSADAAATSTGSSACRPPARDPRGWRAVLFRPHRRRARSRSDLYEWRPTARCDQLATAQSCSARREHRPTPRRRAASGTRPPRAGVVDVDVSEDGNTVMIQLGGPVLRHRSRERQAQPDFDSGAGAPTIRTLSPDGPRVRVRARRRRWIRLGGHRAPS